MLTIHYSKLNKKGAIALTAMMILGSVIILTIISIVLLGISSRFNTFNFSRSEIAFMKTEGCLQEALIQLNRDNSYTGDSYVIDDLSCTVTVTGLTDRTLEVDGSIDDFYHHFTVDVVLTPSFGILDFSY